MSPEQSTGSPEGRTISVLDMTPVQMVDFSYRTKNVESLRRIRVELLRRKAQVPEGTVIDAIDQAYKIVDSNYDELLDKMIESLRSPLA